MKPASGWKRIILLLVMVVMGGCQVVANELETMPRSPTARVEPRLVPSSPTAISEPAAIAVTRLPTVTPTTGSREPIAPTQSPSPAQSEERARSVKINVVYDNNPYDPRLQTAWGFGGLIETQDTTILFDTGGDGPMLLTNMATLGIEPENIEIVFLSHIHGDHTGGLASLLAMDFHPTVYLPHSFPAGFKSQVVADADLVEVDQATEITDGVYTTGEMGSGIIEQALVLSTSRGLVIITGCAHPGIVDMVQRAKEIGGDEIFLVLGGFHLGGTSEGRIKAIIRDFQRLGVQKVAPCHCTGDKAIALFREAYAEDFIQIGVGRVIEIPP